MIIRPLNRAPARTSGPGGGRRAHLSAVGAEQLQLDLSCSAGPDGVSVVTVTGELDIATAGQAYDYLTRVIDGWAGPVSVDLSGLTFCDASGLGALARIAAHARRAGRQLRLTAARPSLLKIMRITGLDLAFPELGPELGQGAAAVLA